MRRACTRSSIPHASKHGLYVLLNYFLFRKFDSALELLQLARGDHQIAASIDIRFFQAQLGSIISKLPSIALNPPLNRLQWKIIALLLFKLYEINILTINFYSVFFMLLCVISLIIPL